jgi:hypothetical protein
MISKCRILKFNKIEDSRGNLTPIENGGDLPFILNRIYYLYDVPGGSVRGSHAHKKLHQIIIALSGSFDISIDDGNTTAEYHLNSPSLGLYLCPMIWRGLKNFSSGSVCLVLASDTYDESDYIRDYSTFLKALLTL